MLVFEKIEIKCWFPKNKNKSWFLRNTNKMLVFVFWQKIFFVFWAACFGCITRQSFMALSQVSPHLQTQLKDASRLTFSWPFSYISFSSFSFPGTLYRIFLLFLPQLPCHFYHIIIEQQQQRITGPSNLNDPIRCCVWWMGIWLVRANGCCNQMYINFRRVQVNIYFKTYYVLLLIIIVIIILFIIILSAWIQFTVCRQVFKT